MTETTFRAAQEDRIRALAREEITAGPDAVMHYSSEAPGLVCALCLFAVKGEAAPADTVIAGYAVCVNHAGYVQNESFARLLGTLIDAERKRTEREQ